MTPIEIIALILIAVSVIKIITILIKPQAWANLVKKIWANSMLTSGISLILAAVVLYYLIQSGLTIVQILAVTAFVALLMAVGIGIYAKDVVSVATKMLKKGIMKKAWLYTLLWVALIVWGVIEIFGLM